MVSMGLIGLVSCWMNAVTSSSSEQRRAFEGAVVHVAEAPGRQVRQQADAHGALRRHGR
jgi:hypothetical protein